EILVEAVFHPTTRSDECDKRREIGPRSCELLLKETQVPDAPGEGFETEPNQYCREHVEDEYHRFSACAKTGWRNSIVLPSAPRLQLMPAAACSARRLRTPTLFSKSLNSAASFWDASLAVTASICLTASRSRNCRTAA